MNSIQSLQGTGRTTRMLREAIAINAEGHNVFLIASSQAEAARIFRQLHEIMPKGLTFSSNAMNGKIVGANIQWIWVTTAEKIGFDWEEMRAFTYGPETVYLVDHHAIEAKFGPLLEMLHRWDQPSASETSTEVGATSITEGPTA